MKKLLIPIAILLMLILLCSCEKDSKAPIDDKDGLSVKNDAVDVTEPDFSWQAQDLHTGFNSATESLPQTAIIKNTDELYEYSQLYVTKYSSTPKYLSSPYTDEYTDDFFEENYLIAVYSDAPSGSIQRKMKEVVFKNGNIDITIFDLSPVMGTDDMSGWTHLITIPRHFEVEKDNISVEYYEIAPFGYVDDLYFLDKDKTVIEEGFVNTKESAVSDDIEAKELAIKEIEEMDFKYGEVRVAYDLIKDWWRVTFYSENSKDDYIRIYMDSLGITQAIIK